MDTSKKITRKLYNFLSDSFSELSSLISRSEEFHSPPDQALDEEHSFDQAFDHSLEMGENETVVLSKDEYSKLQKELSVLEQSLHNSSKQKDEYKKLLLDYDTTMSFILEKEENTNAETLITKLKEKDELVTNLRQKIEQYRHRETNLQNYVDAVQKDLDKAVERAELYKVFGKEKIKEVEGERDRLLAAERMKNHELCYRISELAKAIEEKSTDNVELVEYCRYLLNSSTK